MPKSKKSLSVRLEQALHDQVMQLAENRGVKAVTILEEAVHEYLQGNQEQASTPPPQEPAAPAQPTDNTIPESIQSDYQQSNSDSLQDHLERLLRHANKWYWYRKR